MVNLHCQPEEIQNFHENTTLGISERVFTKDLMVGRIDPECG